ncbi:15023_t:CDS:2, partial [Gigaspora margarita]
HLENIAKETFSRKLALTLSKTGTIDYGNEEIEQQILVFLNKGIKDKDTKKVRQEDSLELEDEKVYFMIWDLPNRISKKQVTEIIKKFGQPKEIHILHSMNNKTRTEVEWSSMREDIKRKLEANWVLQLRNKWEYTMPYRKGSGNMIISHVVTTRRPSVIQYNQVSQAEKENHNRREWQKEKKTRKKEKIPQAPNERLNNKEEIDQERHRLEKLVQRLVKEIKEKLI